MESNSNYGTFRGRMNRLEFLMNSLLIAGVLALATWIFDKLGLFSTNDVGFMRIVLAIIYFVILYLMVKLNLSFITRRLHDIGISGLMSPFIVFIPAIFYNIPLVSLISGALLILLVFWPGQRKNNKYGSIPEGWI